ncbi:IS110 family transposase [Phytoactinopolyspora endophytica]|uniref:IS110 family transposase n=1 Tax=Phytoactinopolyspora endophytica TaxID=1642495 RepID=UPI001F0D0DE9|nr:transposase [Phytoactinopolyspora endophytica]
MPGVTKKNATITSVSVGDVYGFVVGVDTHAASHSYAIVVARTGALVDEQTFPTKPAGLARACDWIARRTDGEVSGVLVSAEGTGSYGAPLAEELAKVGYRVEAPTPRRERGRGKTDVMDAVTAARGTLSMPVTRLRDRRGAGQSSQDQVALQVLTTSP